MDRIERILRDMNPVSGSAADSQSAEYLPDIFKNGSGHPEDINPVASLAERRKRRGRLQVVIGTASVAVLGLVVAGLFFFPQANNSLVPAGPSDSGSNSSSMTSTTNRPTQSSPSPTETPQGLSCSMGSVTAVLPDPAGNPLPNYVASNPEFFTPLGCAEGWMAFELNDRGSAALGVSPGQNSYNYFARKKGEKYEFAMLSLQKYNRNTPSDLQIQLMEEQFTRIGIPAQLREALIGNPPV